MTTYAIGDIQGCFNELMNLLKCLNFNPKRDKLWLTGDIVNRGPQSLETLRFVMKHRQSIHMVLGNHDLHFLSVAYRHQKSSKNDTLLHLLSASDKETLCDWLRTQPLLHHDQELGFTMIHAGLAPSWNLTQAITLAQEVHSAMIGKNFHEVLQHMYGDTPNIWNDKLQGIERLRVLINYFTRCRYCDSDGQLDFKEKGAPGSQPAHLKPWFLIPKRKTEQDKIIIGHWASLAGNAQHNNIFALDTGCVWGQHLTAMTLASELQYFREPPD